MLRAATGALVLLALAAPAASAKKCNGEQVTISFQDVKGHDIVGTPGRDVIEGGPKSERISGGAGDDVICGGGDDDIIDGGPGRDELFGEDGSDIFPGLDVAQDVVTGGADARVYKDVVSFARSPVGVRVSLRDRLVIADGSSIRGGLHGIEKVVGSDHDDHLIGDAGSNSFDGHGGNDVLDGRGGNDQLRGGEGADRVTYAWGDEAIDVRLADAEETGTVAMGRGGDIDVDDVDGVEIVVGTRFDDRIRGSDADEQLIGGPGDDVVKGLGGHDTLEGGPGDDILFPGAGDDTADGGANGPVTSAGAHGDLVSYQGDKARIGGASSFDFEAYLVPSPFFHDPPQASGVGDDALIGIESIRAPEHAMSYLEGDAGPNVLIGGAKIDSIEGGAGNDLLYGLGSNDNLTGGAGDDYLDGGGPNGKGEADKLDGSAGDDTCLNALDDFMTSCEATG
ncbi:MAG: calcium-binding protein [Solirubrobacteraceae bacterium]